MVKKINWSALKSAALDMSIDNSYNNLETISETEIQSEEFLKYLHHLLFEVHLLDGSLICPESGRTFPVKDGIPNMLLHEDEL